MSQELSSTYQRRLKKLKPKLITGKPPQLIFLRKDLIKIDRSYQRYPVENKIIEMVANFDWRLFGALSVAHRPNGSFYVMDGQQRLCAANLRPEIVELPCAVHEVESVEEEAKICAKINNSTPFHPGAKFKMLVTAKDPDALEIQDVLDRHGGCALTPKQPGNSPTDIRCAYKVHKFWQKNKESAKAALDVGLKLAERANAQMTIHIFMGLLFVHEREIIRLDRPEVRVNLYNPEIRNRILALDPQTLAQAIRGKLIGAKRGAGSWYGKALGEGVLEMLNSTPSGKSRARKWAWEFATPRKRLASAG